MSAVLEKFMLEHFPTYGATGNLTHARGVEYKQVRNCGTLLLQERAFKDQTRTNTNCTLFTAFQPLPRIGAFLW